MITAAGARKRWRVKRLCARCGSERLANVHDGARRYDIDKYAAAMMRNIDYAMAMAAAIYSASAREDDIMPR